MTCNCPGPDLNAEHFRACPEYPPSVAREAAIQELIAAARDIDGFDLPSNPRFARLRAALKKLELL